MYLFKTPFLLKRLYPDLTWHKSRSEKVIYLSFDDGPIPVVTPFVLKTLKEVEAKATFFCIGDNVRKHPEIFEQVKAAGHRIGNHTFNHLKGWTTEDDAYLLNVQKCQELTHSVLFRPPYGRARRSQFRELRKQYSVIMWDVLSGDFDVSLAPEKCLNKVLKYTENGSIVVFHDSLKAFDRLEYVLPRALATWKSQGFRFERL